MKKDHNNLRQLHVLVFYCWLRWLSDYNDSNGFMYFFQPIGFGILGLVANFSTDEKTQRNTVIIIINIDF